MIVVCAPNASPSQVVQLPGQSSVPAEVLAPVLDDAAVAWSMLVHDARVMLVRGSSFADDEPQACTNICS
jgi:hypothetical protein